MFKLPKWSKNLSLILLLSACTAPNAAPSATPNTTPSAQSPSELSDTELKNIAQSYTSYTALNQDLRSSQAHGGIWVKTYLDAATDKAFQAKSYPFPDGATAVKEGHPSADGAVEKLFVMRKIKGYDPANGDWFYAMTDAKGQVQQKGKLQMCISCHSNAKAKDYLYGFEH